jgi:hypothetical protein
MSERGVLRRSESPSVLSPLLPLAVCTLVALCMAQGVRDVRAANFAGLSPLDSIHLADSLAAAESLRVADSTAFADSVAAVEAEAEAEGTFGTKASILDRSRAGGPISYSSNYGVNRSNTTWGQSMDVHASKGGLEIANVTSVAISREGRVGRVNRSRNTQTELAYRVSPVLRLGGRLGIQRVSDVAKTRNFIGTNQAVDDLSAQARFNKKIGVFPVRSTASYGYLRNDQFKQQSRGSSFDFYAGTAGTFSQGSTLNIDFTQQISTLRSTVADSAAYAQDDRNLSSTLNVSSTMKVNRWVNADARLSTQRSTIRRPAQIFPDPTDQTHSVTVPEKVAGVNDAVDGGLHFQLPLRSRINLLGSASRNRQIYAAQEDRSSLSDRTEFSADLAKFVLGSDWTMRFNQSLTKNDYTRRDPGYVESNLLRRLEGDGSRRISRSASSRFSLGIYLTRRDYENFTSSSSSTNTLSNQDQLRVRGSLSLNYVPSRSFDTGLTLGLEQNDLVNLKNTSSINNARLRTYSVTWNWSARPGTIWNVYQTNSATAAQQFFTFSPTRDLVSYVYTLNTNLTTTLSPQVRLDLQHLVRLQSRGSFRSDGDVRRFGKSSEFNTLDLTLTESYSPSSYATFEISQRLSVNPQFQFANGVSTKTSESRRDELTFVGRFNYPIGKKASLNADVRRVLATDRQRTFGSTLQDRSNNTDYWLVSAGFRMEFFR